MSVISFASHLIRQLQVGLRLTRQACRLAAKIDARLQDSAASAGLKTASTTWLASTTTFCAAVEAFYDSLPGD